ncbi:MAG TPA: PPK2 family polyphosphate kinase [Roseiflexaceae bacterium]|nr:PPK2 family polyphosphate kinase [Roseiflexaceae bacterium]
MPFAVRIDSPGRIKLEDYDPKQDGGLSKDEGKKEFDKLDQRLDVLQEELYAAGSHSVLVIFQGMDTAGKDGAIRTVFRSCNPQGVQVTSFKVPTEEELSHDFLWRIHRHTPRIGQIGIFNRSHYEDVLVVRVHELVRKEVWQQRYEHINAFEALLADNRTIVLKFFLHIDKDEQEERLRDREEEVEKAWKLSAGDWKERTHWDAYQRAYEDAIGRCAALHAPWYIVPSNRKWFRDLAVAEALADTLERYRPQWQATLQKMSAARLAELAAYRAEMKAAGTTS